MRGLAVLLAFALLGCGNGKVGGGGPTPSSGKAERAAAIARELRADPDRAEATISKHGMTVDEWTALLSEIAADEEMSLAYEAALAK